MDLRDSPDEAAFRVRVRDWLEANLPDELRGGLSYVRHHGSLVALIVLAAVTTFLGFAVLTFLPIFTEKVFQEGATTYSRLLAAWSWPRWKRLVKTATRRRPENVRLYEPPEEAPATADLKLRVDEIRAKISAQGEASLTEVERTFMKDASRRFKKR